MTNTTRVSILSREPLAHTLAINQSIRIRSSTRLTAENCLSPKYEINDIAANALIMPCWFGPYSPLYLTKATYDKLNPKSG